MKTIKMPYIPPISTNESSNESSCGNEESIEYDFELLHEILDEPDDGSIPDDQTVEMFFECFPLLRHHSTHD